MQKSQSKQLLHDRGICVVIPTYNNEGTIADLVRRTLDQCDDVIVVNDGSTDHTAKILKEIQGITLVDYAKNAGKGTALKRGFKKALELGFAYAITLDSDGQHYPEDIPLLLEGNIKYPGSIIIGQRKLEGAVRTKGAKFANAFSNFWFCVQTFHYLPDTQTGYRLYPLHKLNGLSLLTSRYEAELELLVFSSWHGVKIVPVEVNVYYPPLEKRVSHFRPGLDFTRISVLNTILCVLALVYALPCALIRFLYHVFLTIVSIVVFLIGALAIISPFVFISKLFKMGSQPIHKILHWFSIYVTRGLSIFSGKITIQNPHKERFDKPAVLICNHQSHLDLMLQLSLTKKIVCLTNDWAWGNPFYGYIIRNAEYIPASMSVEQLIPKLKSLVARGYCISIFPEGTRSADCSIGRFHKGAFHLAKELGIDILPVVLYGAGKVLPKEDYYMHCWPMYLSIGQRVSIDQLNKMGATEREQTNNFRKYYKERYSQLCNEIEQHV